MILAISLLKKELQQCLERLNRSAKVEDMELKKDLIDSIEILESEYLKTWNIKD